MRVKICIGAILLSLSNSPFAGPFGLEMGASLEQLSKQMELKPVKEYMYATSEVPKPNENFESYTLVITPEHGLCKIGAMGKTINTNSFGDSVKGAFGEINEALRAKYGEPETFDYVKSGSMWDDSKYWMMGLLKDERTLASYWGKKGGLPDHLKSIMLKAKAVSPDKAYLSLAYEFETVSECLRKMKEKNNSSL